jgi:uncharacterized membrane protein YfhO
MRINRQNLMERTRRFFAGNCLAFVAFGLPALILLIGYMTRGIFPVGNRNVLTIDLYHQYAPFIEELRNKLTSGGSLFFTWAGGLGTNFWALTSYYLASPLNIILILFPPAFVTEAIMLLTLIKIGLCGAFFFVFLRGVWQEENYKMVAVSGLYALSAYSLAYSWNIMWLDGLFILPLMMLGMVRLVRDRRGLLYCLSLAYILYTNYYIAFFIVLFTVLYFPICLFRYQSFRQMGKLLLSILRFAGLSLLGAGLSAIMLLPTYFSLQLTSAANDAFPKTVTHYFQLFDYIGQHFMLVSPTIRDGMPNMYCGILALLMIPIYFFAKSVPLRQKFLHVGLILLLILSFNINVLNFIWHGKHFPNQLPYRNSFVYIFLILSIAYPALRSLKEFTGKQIGAVCASAIALVLLAQKLNEKAVELQTIYVTIIFIIIYAAVLTLDRVGKIRSSDVALAILLVVIAELTLNTLLTVHRIDTTEYYSSREGYMSGEQVAQIRTAVATIAEEEGKGTFYRMEAVPPKTINDGFMYNYRGLSIFASTMATKPVKTFENLGFHSNGINSYKYESSTIVLDSLFGIKYLIRRSGNAVDRLRRLVMDESLIDVYKNPYALPIGYLGRPELKDWQSSSGDPLKAQNRLVMALSGVDDVFKPVERQSGDVGNMTLSNTGTSSHYSYTRTNTDQESSVKVNIQVETDGQIYLYFQTAANKPSRGYVMVGETRVDFNAKRSTLVDVGFVEGGTSVEFNLFYASDSSKSGSFNLHSYALDQEAFEKAHGIIRDNGLRLDRFTDTRIEGAITARQAGVLMLSVPYDEGWSITVDDQPAVVIALDEGFIGIDLEEGHHTIKMKYLPPWFNIGLLVSLASLLILLIVFLLPSGTNKRAASGKKQLRPVSLQPDEAPSQPDLPRTEISPEELIQENNTEEAPDDSDNQSGYGTISLS